MKKYNITFILIGVILLTSIVVVYSLYKDSLIFAPDIFITELLKFIGLTITWTIIVKYYNKYEKEVRKNKISNYLIIHNIARLKIKLEKGIVKDELNNNIKSLINNIDLIIKINEFEPKELDQVLNIRNNLLDEKFQEAIADIEFLIENNKNYIENKSYNLIINELNNLNYVFRNK